MGPFRKALIAAQILLCLTLPFTKQAAAAGFDGVWTVQIAASTSACGNGATVSFDINNGQVASGSGMLTASGHVADSGSINVTLASGVKRAIGSGHLSATSGSGTWHGVMCSGTWRAEKT